MDKINNRKLMSQASNINHNILETNGNNQPIQQSIMMYLQNPIKNIRNKGYIDTVKVLFIRWFKSTCIY